MAIEKLYSVDEAAEALGISYWTVWGKLKNGELRRTKVGGRTVIRESELQRLIVDLPLKPLKAYKRKAARTVEAAEAR